MAALRFLELESILRIDFDFVYFNIQLVHSRNKPDSKSVDMPKKRYSSTSIPSYATSMPSATTLSLCSDSSFNIGFVLFMCISILRGFFMGRKTSNMPPVPD